MRCLWSKKRKAAEAAARWWVENGDPKRDDSPIHPEHKRALKRFHKILVKKTMVTVCTWAGTPIPTVLSVDYRPTGILADAADESGLDKFQFHWPWKTYTYVTPTKAIAYPGGGFNNSGKPIALFDATPKASKPKTPMLNGFFLGVDAAITAVVVMAALSVDCPLYAAGFALGGLLIAAPLIAQEWRKHTQAKGAA